MKQRVSVMQIMTSKPVVLNIKDTLDEAERLFKKHNIRHIPVVDGKKIIGMLSLTDLLRISFADVATDDNDNDVVEAVVYNMFTIPQVMTKTPMTVDVSTSIREVAEILARESFHALPVTEAGELVGIVTTTDLINYLLLQYY
ncbi:CBS domain-containing protein [Flavobacterium sp. RHBU_3]|uniref:CBS domain-containing protein n=1 Tax=Flavobacterium sp. RHBU_3 TaxID=3391184 RepID=UPI00398507A1